MTEDGMVGWPHRLTQHKFEQAPGDSEGQGSLACCGPWGCEESDTTQRLTELKNVIYIYIKILLHFTYFPGGANGKESDC